MLNYDLDRNNAHAHLAYCTILRTKKPVFITGNAGTGKSKFLNHVMKARTKKMVVVAPTVAAANLIGGMTIHRFFSFPSELIRDWNRHYKLTP